MATSTSGYSNRVNTAAQCRNLIESLRLILNMCSHSAVGITILPECMRILLTEYLFIRSLLQLISVSKSKENIKGFVKRLDNSAFIELTDIRWLSAYGRLSHLDLSNTGVRDFQKR